MYQAGFYEFDITPPLGSMIPGGFWARYNNRILDKIYARAMVVTEQDKTVAVVVLDACGVTLDITERIRERVVRFIPIKPRDIMVMATHTHGGGPVLTWGEEVVRSENYLDFMVEKAADSIICAYQQRKESKLHIGKDHLYGVSFIRIYRMKNGGLKTNPGMGNPDAVKPFGEIDPEVIVLTVLQEGKPVGAVVNFACHPAIVAKDMTSGDFISVLSEEMKKTHGNDFVTVFINGACGNINHINVLEEQTAMPGRQVVIGSALAEKTAQIMMHSEALEGPLHSFEKTIQVRLRKPSIEALIDAKNHLDSLEDNLIHSVPRSDGYVETFFALQAFQIERDKRTLQDIYLQAIQIGNLSLLGSPGQIFVEYGRMLKENCLSSYCMVSAFANDYSGYVPTPECMVEGVYEARLAPTSGLEPQAGEQICKGLLELISK